MKTSHINILKYEVKVSSNLIYVYCIQIYLCHVFPYIIIE
jgi:hypothetical protein